MNLPRMTGEASLYSSTERYRGYCAPKPAVAGVTPSQPPGSTYQQSCINCQYLLGEDLFLICDCYDESGHLHSTSIAPNYCGGPIANCNGNLCC